MRTPFQFEILHSSVEATGLEDFARSFDHSIEDAYPIIVAKREGQLRAYAQLERRTIVTPAIHPELNSPRDTLEATGAFVSLMRQMRPGFLLQWSTDPKFTDSLVKKLGIQRWPFTLYSPVD